MQRLVRFAIVGSVLFVSACSNGSRKGWDTLGAGAQVGVSGGKAGPVTTSTAAGSVAPAMTTPDTSKHATPVTTTKKP